MPGVCIIAQPTWLLHWTWLLLFLAHHSSCVHLQVTALYAILSNQGSAASIPYRSNHTHSSSFSKHSISPPSKDYPDAALPKQPQSFRSNSQSSGSSYAPSQHCLEAHFQSTIVLPVCAVCLGCHKHSMPVVFCPAKCTWDDKFDIFVEHFNKALQVKDMGATLCTAWQWDSGCSEQHDNMHQCSGCEALTHGTSKCPQAQKVSSSNSL